MPGWIRKAPLLDSSSVGVGRTCSRRRGSAVPLPSLSCVCAACHDSSIAFMIECSTVSAQSPALLRLSSTKVSEASSRENRRILLCFCTVHSAPLLPLRSEDIEARSSVSAKILQCSCPPWPAAHSRVVSALTHEGRHRPTALSSLPLSAYVHVYVYTRPGFCTWPFLSPRVPTFFALLKEKNERSLQLLRLVLEVFTAFPSVGVYRAVETQ